MILKSHITGMCLIAAIFLLVFSPGCSIGENPDTTPVTIDLGLNEKGATRSVTGKDAALSDVTAINITVSGPGMSTMTETIPLATGALTLNVPSGSARLFQVTAVNPYGNLGGSATADLEAGTPADLAIVMDYQYTDVTINVNYPDGVPGSSSLTYTISITDTTSDLLVYGPQTFPEGTSFQVPSGDNKSMEIDVDTPSVTFKGALSNQLLPGDGTASFNVDVSLSETKIIIPDPGPFSSIRRLVQMDEIGDTGSWVTINYNDLANFAAQDNFRPWDVDFDARGRIYIANNNTNPNDIIVRIDDITCTNEFPISSAITSNITSLAVDRQNNLLYYISNSYSGIYRVDLNNVATNAELTITAGIAIKYYSGIAVDDTGLLYVSNNDPSDLSIYKIDPNAAEGSRVIDSRTTGFLSPRDVMVKSNFLYVADYDSGLTSHKIVQLNISDMSVSDELVNSGSYPMFGPQRFVAILNRKIYFIDETDSGNNDILASMDDIDGNGWFKSGSNGTGINQFYFFYGC